MTEPYKRKCANWLQTYVQWTQPRCESPDTFIMWSGLFALAGAVRRHVKVPREVMGGWEISPNLYVLFVAPPGKARKSTTIGFAADDILNELTITSDVTRAPTIVTQAALLKQIVDSGDSSVYIASHEFSSFVMKSKIEMFEFLTDLYDGKRHIEATTIGRGMEFAERPCCNMLAATTPRWITENMPESVIGGGLASRIIFVYEDKVRRRQLYYEGLNHEHLDKLREDLIADLKHISQIHGDFQLEDDAKSFMEEWYKRNAEVPDADYRLAGYLERRPAHIHKVAMLLHLSRSDTLFIELEDFQKAIYLLDIIEQKLPQVFREIGKNVHAPDMTQIKEYVDNRKRVSRQELLRQFSSSAHPTLLQELIVGLIQMNYMYYDEATKEFISGQKPS